jgi:hypothetical protein
MADNPLGELSFDMLWLPAITKLANLPERPERSQPKFNVTLSRQQKSFDKT